MRACKHEAVGSLCRLNVKYVITKGFRSRSAWHWVIFLIIVALSISYVEKENNLYLEVNSNLSILGEISRDREDPNGKFQIDQIFIETFLISFNKLWKAQFSKFFSILSHYKSRYFQNTLKRDENWTYN